MEIVKVHKDELGDYVSEKLMDGELRSVESREKYYYLQVELKTGLGMK